MRNCRNSHRRCSLKKGFRKNGAKFTEKHQCQSLFFNKVAGPELSSFFSKAFWNTSNKCFEVSSGAFTVKFEHISYLFLVFIVDSVQVNVCWDGTSNFLLESLSSIRILDSIISHYPNFIDLYRGISD